MQLSLYENLTKCVVKQILAKFQNLKEFLLLWFEHLNKLWKVVREAIFKKLKFFFCFLDFHAITNNFS